MIKEIPIEMINDFPIVSGEYKKGFSKIDSHIIVGARIIDKYLIDELAMSIYREGLHHPVIVRPYGKCYQMISGHLRKYAFKKLSRDVIPAKTVEVDNVTAKAMLITSNRLQMPLDAIEESWVVRNLIDNDSKNYRDIAKYIGVSKSWVYNRYMLSKRLVQEIQIDIVMGLIPKGIATELSFVQAPGQNKVAKAIKGHKLSFRESRELIRIIKNKEISDRVKELALDDPRTVIVKLANKDENIIHKSDNGLSYFASNFKEEVDKLNYTALDVLHRLKRDYKQFKDEEKNIVSKNLFCAYKRISQLKKSMEDYDLWEKI